MTYTHIVCLKSWFDPLNRNKAIHIKDTIYMINKAPAKGFYSALNEQGYENVSIQEHSERYQFITLNSNFNNELLSFDGAICQINDCFVNIFYKKPTIESIIIILNCIPLFIIRLAEQWGWNDTVVGDKIYSFIKEEWYD